MTNTNTNKSIIGNGEYKIEVVSPEELLAKYCKPEQKGKSDVRKPKNEEPQDEQTEKPIILNSQNFIASDFIHLKTPTYEFDISISEDRYKSQDWYSQNKSLLSNGYLMPNILEGMTLFQEVVNANKDSKHILFDSAGNPINKDTIEDLYKFLTSDYKNGSLQHLNALFENKNGVWLMKEAINYDKSQDKLNFRETQISVPIRKDCYIDFTNLTPQGLPTKISSNKDYAKGENIYYLKPEDGRIARFYADSGGAGLSCLRDPYTSIYNVYLGVRALRR